LVVANSGDSTVTISPTFYLIGLEQYCPEDGFRDSANAMQGKELNAILVFVDLKSEESKTALAEGK